MEFREYWQIVWRRRTLIVPLVVVTFLASLIFNLVLPPTYKTDTTVYVQALIPPPAANPYFSEEYYRTVYSEYISDDLGEIVRYKDFAQKIADRVQTRFGRTVAVKDVADAISKTKRVHRTLKITVATGSEALTRQIAQALDDVLRSDGTSYFTSAAGQPVNLLVIDPPQNPTSPSALRRLLDVLLHSAVALAVGVGLAFLLHYLDDRIQDEEDAARTLAWPVLGAVPADGAPAAADRAAAGLVPWRRGGATAGRRLASHHRPSGASLQDAGARRRPLR